MKKKFFLSTLFAVSALISMAQGLLVVLAPVNLDSVTTSAVLITGQQQNGSGVWFSKPFSNKIGTNVWTPGVIITHQGSYQPVAHWVYNLGSDSNYQFKIIYSYDSLFAGYDSTITEIVHTKPLAQPVDFISATPLSLLPKSGFKSTAASTGRPSIMFGLDATTFAATTDTVPVAFTSNFTDTIFFLSNIPGVSSPATRIYVRSLDGLSTDVSPIMNGFAPPIPTGAVMTATYTRTSSSVHIPLNVTSIGNAGASILGVTITDTTGPVIYYSQQTVTSTGIINVDTNNLLSNHWYRVFATITNQYGFGSIVSFSFKTLNVDNPTVVASSGTSGFTDYTVIGYVNRQGTGDSSDIAIARLQKNGVTLDSVVLPTSDTLVFHETNKPLNTNETVTIKVINKAGLSGTSAAITAQTTPVLKPSLTNNTPVKTQKSVSVTVNVTSLGNSGNPELKIHLADASTGSQVYDTSLTVTATGLMTFIMNVGVTSNHDYIFSDTLTNSLHVGDTLSLLVHTPNVNPPSITATYTRTYTDYTITSVPNQNGTWDSSAIKQLNYYEDGVLVGIDSTGGTVFNRGGRTQGQLYQIKVEVVNKANLLSSTLFSITMQVLQQNQAPAMNDLFADDASTLRVSIISYGASAGNVSNPRLVRRDAQTGIVDTVNIASGLVGTGTINEYVYTDCIGGHTLQITVIDDNLAGRVVGNTLQQGMPAPEPSPVISAILKDIANNTANILAVTVRGSTEGNVAILKIHAYENNVEIAGSPFTSPQFSGDVNVSYAWDQRTQNTQHRITAELTNVTGGGYDIETVFISTELGTGIDEISAKTPQQDEIVWVYNYIGQEVARNNEYSNTYKNLRDMYAGKMLLFQVRTKDGIPTGKTYSIFMQ